MAVVEHFCVFNKGGAVVWRNNNVTAEVEQSINALVQNVLLEATTGTTFRWNNKYHLQWLMDNDNDLVFVVVVTLQLNRLASSHLNGLLSRARNLFESTRPNTEEFGKQMVAAIADRPLIALEAPKRTQPRPFRDTQKACKIGAGHNEGTEDEAKETERFELDWSRDQTERKQKTVPIRLPHVSPTSIGNCSWSWMDSLPLIGLKRELTTKDLEPIVQALQNRMVSNNVSVDVAKQLTETVAANLLGKRLAAWESVRSTVQKALESKIQRMLTGRDACDSLLSLFSNTNGSAARSSTATAPFTIALVGVNGVGKTTSLAKLTYHLLLNGKTVSVVACDTFRAGAVEQLRTHCHALNVSLFERGYNKDAAAVARAGIAEAHKSGKDVVLIDTAGRMQNALNLMQALTKLIAVNQPNMILMVVDAQVGVDGTHQIVEFQRAIAASGTECACGILLTKMDTVSNKVGTAINLSHATSIPICFLGTGQTYADLACVNVNMLAKAILQ